MKISYRWLQEFVEIEWSARELAERLTMVGLAVDSVEEHGHDQILDFDLTSNRPDCLSHLGIAREVSVLTGKPLIFSAGGLTESLSQTADQTSVEVLDPDLCPRYTARLIRGVRIGPSPDWMVTRLEALGQRSINNVADITNYVLLELGQPLHAFDFARLAGQRIIVRRALDGERLVTLDGVERALNPQMLVIADAERAVALAGIMGGGDSEITETTVDVLLESAYFTPSSIRATARELGMSTEASYRFERGVDPQNADRASDRAAALMAELAGGEVSSGLIDVRTPLAARPQIQLRSARYERLTGLKVDSSEATRILTALGLEVGSGATGEVLIARAPSWRIDLAIEEDLIEEVARINGYDRLVTTLPGGAGAGGYLSDEKGRRTTRQTLTGAGFHEAINFSFVNAESDQRLSQSDSAVIDTAGLKLSNPIDETQSQMRTTLLGGLLDAVARNINHGTRNLRLFEIGKCFVGGESQERPLEKEKIALILTGGRNERDWRAASERVDFYDLKGVIEEIAENLGKNPAEFHSMAGIGYLHPGRAAIISLAGKEIGFAGQLHPAVANSYKFKQPVYLAELDFGAMLESEALDVRYRPLPKYPAVLRDLSLLAAEDVTFAEIESGIKNLAIPELVGIRLFDLYTGRELPVGRRALALSLRYQAVDRTLTDDEITAAHRRVLRLLIEQFGAEIR
jgi:phenylalanyl-tRNA synthetase beta chain